MAERKLYIGMDVNNSYALVSYFMDGKKEPETISTIAGSEIYQIPLALYKKRGIGQWYFGREAREIADAESGTLVEDLWTKAAAGEVVRIEEQDYDALDLLTVFFRKVLMLPRRVSGEMKITSLGVTIENLTMENTELFGNIMEKIGIRKEQYFMIDHKESFYYYALSQDRELWMHDVALFSYEKEQLRSCYLTRNENTKPQMITLTATDYGKLTGDRDLEFTDIIKEAFAGKIISSTFLVGNGFEGDWMKQSIRVLCSGRRAFLGKNLYSKGVCYAACVRDEVFLWPFVYIGEHELKFNVSMKVRDGDQISFFSLLSAGESCYEAEKECEVILDDSSKINFWLQYPEGSEAKVESLELTDLPERPNRETRLRIHLKPLSDREIKVVIKDLGFGELQKSSDKVWEYVMRM